MVLAIVLSTQPLPQGWIEQGQPVHDSRLDGGAVSQLAGLVIQSWSVNIYRVCGVISLNCNFTELYDPY